MILSEEAIEAGMKAAEDEGWADVLPNDVAAIYLAMRAKEQAAPDDVERVARALCVVSGQDPDGFDPCAICDSDSRPLPLWMAFEEEARAAIDAMGSAALTAVTPDGLLDWLGQHTNLELSWGELGDDLSEAGWRVHRRFGGVNDRDWDLLGVAETPLAALEIARTALGEEG